MVLISAFHWDTKVPTTNTPILSCFQQDLSKAPTPHALLPCRGAPTLPGAGTGLQGSTQGSPSQTAAPSTSRGTHWHWHRASTHSGWNRMKSKHPNAKQPAKLSAKQAELKPEQDLSIFYQWHLCQLPPCHFHECFLEQLHTHSAHWDTPATGKLPPCFPKKTHVCLWGFYGRASTDPLQELVWACLFPHHTPEHTLPVRSQVNLSQ